MNENKKQKIMKTILGLMISFLIIFIAAMFARAASNTILPENSTVSVFINDYLDMMMQRIDKIAVKMKIKRNSVSEYQVNLITQSISDYVGYSMYQTAESLKEFNPNNNASKAQLDKYKNNYYRMTVENPYLRGMTVFNSEGKMLLNLYLSRNKSWPLELQDTLINEIKTKGSLVLNATNENAFYIMEYIKNPYGEIIVATRNDYAYVSDIAMYYQVADKRLYVSDSRNSVYNVRESIGDNNIEKVSSVINRYAYYKKQPSFIVNDSLSVSMIGKEYPNYFELIVLAITALLILLCQLIIKGVAAFFKYLMQIKNNKDYVESVKGSDELLNKNIIDTDMPKSSTLEEMPPIIQKVHYKIPEEYIKENNNNNENTEEQFHIGKDILNIVSSIKEEINLCKNKFAITKEDLKEKEEQKENIKTDDAAEAVITSEENLKEEILSEELVELNNNNNNNNNNEINIEHAFENINRELQEEHRKAIEEAFALETLEEEETLTEQIIIEEELKDDEISENIVNAEEEYTEEQTINNTENSNEEETQSKEEVFMSISDDELEAKPQDSFIAKTLSLDNYKIAKETEENNLEYRKIESDDIFNKKTIINSLKDKEENKNLFIKKNDDYKTSDYSNISKDILNSYNKAIDNIKADNTKKEDLNSSPVSRTDDVFAAFDKMLSSIISKAEEDAKRSITKNK
ncbi:hypothetical protein [Brachyspira murdochii]|uniref:hypothetical protein n=1 Tax=Brachyspira murdochii TaxID=84378 RepID=UPI0012F4DEFD|nr:hypothetical protein [Brachyspira murdochii]